MTQAASFRGQPLLLLGGLLLGWTGLRVALWQPWPEEEVRTDPGSVAASAVAVQEALPHIGPAASIGTSTRPSPATVRFASAAAKQALPVEFIPLPTSPLQRGSTLDRARASFPPPPGVPAAAPSLAAAERPLPSPQLSRWTGDAWLLLRDDTTTPILSGRPSYGRSQAGAVIRYRLARSSAHVPQAHLRASSALAGVKEHEVVLGLSARPLARMPLRLALEGRLSETDAGTEIRPAAFAVTELPPLALPLGATGEIYLQGGYVGGRFATAFADGQVSVERALLRSRGAEVRVGAGAWGGAQEGAERLDVGPSASVAFRLGAAYGRIAADYRFRVAGDAEPSSGPALTVSAGF